MVAQVDIQMPLRKGSFIRGDVLQRLMIQDVPFNFYLDAGEELTLTPEQEREVESTTPSAEEAEKLKRWLRIVFKRNRLRFSGDSPYVYISAADILLPESPVFGGIVEVFEKYPQFGCIGVSYNGSHPRACSVLSVACGSMMLRRTDLIQHVGEIRCAPYLCDCRYIRQKLILRGLQVLPLRESARAIHLHEEYEQPNLEYKDVRCRLSPDGTLSQSLVKEILEQYGTDFKLFIDV